MKNIHWIQGDNTCESPLFRRSFRLKALPASATIEICGLGYFQLFLGGRRVGNDEFVPAMTGYSSVLGCDTSYPVWEERSRHRTLYLTYDLLPYLQVGENVLGVQLGSGWYHQTRRVDEGSFVFGFPKLRYELSIRQADGGELFLESDRETLWRPSEVTENNLFYGETQDLRLVQQGWCLPGADLSGWQPARPAHAPETELAPQTCPPDRVLRELNPVLLAQDGAVRLYDCGENIAGWVSLRCAGRSGDTVRVRHSEEPGADGCSLDFRSTGGANQIQEDRYICDGSSAVVRPKFCWHGFRYFTVEGPGEVVSASVVCTDVAVTSAFRCSNPVLNWLYDAYIRSQLGNYHGCIPSDCPHRERLGYTGDGQLTAETAMLTLDTKRLYEKWYRDILDSQGADTGHIPHTAPFMGGGGGPGGWGCAVYVVPMRYYEIYGDTALLELGCPAMLRWLEYMHSRCENGLVVREEEGGWCLGEWCAPAGEQMPPEPFINTYYYIQGLEAARDAARILHRDLPVWIAERRSASLHAMERLYYDAETGDFCGGVGAANAFALNLGLGDARTRDNLIARYRAAGQLDTGIFGTPVLAKRLFLEGEGDLAVSLLTGGGRSSFAGMMRDGATTLWERWEGTESHNHPMFGSVVTLLFTELLGIRQAEGSAGFAGCRIDPADVASIDWAEGHVQTSAGRIAVKWARDADGKIVLEEEHHG